MASCFISHTCLCYSASTTTGVLLRTYLKAVSSAAFYMLWSEIQCHDTTAYKRDLKAEEEWRHSACLTYSGPPDLKNPRRSRGLPVQVRGLDGISVCKDK